jgi:3-oxoacyl-[acyl-carrier-protein] synthase II
VGAVITGFGVVSPIGSGRPAFAAGLRSAACGVGPITRFDASAWRSGVAAEVSDDVRAAFAPTGAATGVPVRARWGRTSLYALAAVAEALEHAGLHRDDLADPRCGIAFGGSTAGTPEAEAELLDCEDLAAFWTTAPVPVLLTMPVGATVDALVWGLRPGGPVSTISTACSSATNAAGLALSWLRAGHCDRVLVVGADAHCRLTHTGFNALQLVAPERPLPFDARRQGMVIGEGAAAFVIEDEGRAKARGAPVRGRLLGFGNVAEAHHLVQPREDGEGASRSMAAALTDAGVDPSRVDYVNAHGTATIQNDASEARGIHRVLGPRAASVPVSSTKSQVGHLLGASGAVELAAVLLGMEGGFLPPNVGWEVADEDVDLDIPAHARPARVGVALSNSFAFGGNNSSICVGHADLEDR